MPRILSGIMGVIGKTLTLGPPGNQASLVYPAASGSRIYNLPGNAGGLAWKGYLAGFESGWTPIASSSNLTNERMHAVNATAGDFVLTLPPPESGLRVGVYVRAGASDNASAVIRRNVIDGAVTRIAGRPGQDLRVLPGNMVVLQCRGFAVSTVVYYEWVPLVLDLDTPWRNAGAMTVTAETTNPSKGVPILDRVLWRRQGADLHLRYEYEQTTAGTAGTGLYRFAYPALPLAVTHDPNFTAEYGATDTIARANPVQAARRARGSAVIASVAEVTSERTLMGVCVPGDTGQWFRIYIPSLRVWVGSAASDRGRFTRADLSFSIDVTIPASAF